LRPCKSSICIGSAIPYKSLPILPPTQPIVLNNFNSVKLES
ncbi:unnamed protein product, partial [Rotaria sordida]